MSISTQATLFSQALFTANTNQANAQANLMQLLQRIGSHDTIANQFRLLVTTYDINKKKLFKRMTQRLVASTFNGKKLTWKLNNCEITTITKGKTLDSHGKETTLTTTETATTETATTATSPEQVQLVKTLKSDNAKAEKTINQNKKKLDAAGLALRKAETRIKYLEELINGKQTRKEIQLLANS